MLIRFLRSFIDMSIEPSQALIGYQGSAPPPESPAVRATARQHVSLPILCDGCHRFVIPRERHTIGGCAVASAVGLCFVQPLLAAIPLCCNTFKDIMHVCPNCRTRLSVTKRNSWL